MAELKAHSVIQRKIELEEASAWITLADALKGAEKEMRSAKAD